MSLFGGQQQSTGNRRSVTANSSPIIASYRVQTSVEGAVVPLVYGRTRISPNIIWCGDFQAIPHVTTTTTSSGGGAGGGKGGGGSPGGGSSTTIETSYTYSMAVIMALCLGLIRGVGNIWCEKSQGSLGQYFDGVALGARPQDVWGYLQTYHPDQDLPYFGLAYAYAAAADLGDNAQLPNFSFEIEGLCQYDPTNGIYDANPKDIVADFLTNPYYGAGWLPQWLADLTEYSNYCIANDILFSPQLTEQRQALDYLQQIIQLTNAEAVWSEGKLKIIPYGDSPAAAHGVEFIPNLTPLYDLGPDDFVNIVPIIDPTRSSPADAYNVVPLEFLDRDNSYNTAIADPQDQAAVEAYGLLAAGNVEAHCITNGILAAKVSGLLRDRGLFIRNTYKFSLDYRYCLLEPMDWVTLTYPPLGLDRLPVRITSTKEADDGKIDFEAEEWSLGAAAPALYTVQERAGYELNCNIGPGNVTPPVILEPPAPLTAKGYEVWIGACGGQYWGGCEVWLSLDNANYRKIGLIAGPSRLGKLTATFPAGDDPDQVNTLSVDLADSRGALVSGSQNDVDALATLCAVEGELIAYRDATFKGGNQYDLAYLRRGAYGTAIAPHPADAQFLRLDNGIFKYPFQPDQIGQTIYLKFLSYNIWRGVLQSLGDVEPYQYTLGGGSLKANLPDVQNLVDFYLDSRVNLKWDDVDDPLKAYRQIDYEVRLGDSFDTASVLGRTKSPQFLTQGNGTYWVVAHYLGSYSPNPVSITITNAVLPANVLQTSDEAAAGWPGSMSGGVFVDGNGALKIAPNTPYPYTGAYEIPPEHIVDLGCAQICSLSQNYLSKTIDPTVDFDAYPNVDQVADIDGIVAGKADVEAQIALSQDGANWGAWQKFQPGKYILRKVKWRLFFTVLSGPATPVVSAWSFTCDMPNRVDNRPLTACPAGGLAVIIDPAFQTIPAVSVGILNEQPGDIVVFLAAVTTAGYTVQIQNGGVGVARNLSLIHLGY